MKRSRGTRPGSAGGAGKPADAKAREALAWLEAKSTKRDRDNLARFGINPTKAFGVSITDLTIRTLFEEVEIRDAMVKMGMNEGWSSSLDRLAALLAKR